MCSRPALLVCAPLLVALLVVAVAQLGCAPPASEVGEALAQVAGRDNAAAAMLAAPPAAGGAAAAEVPGGGRGGASGALPPSYVETIPGSDVRFEMVLVAEAGVWIGRTEVTWDEYLLYCDFDTERAPDAAEAGVDAVARPSKPLPDVSPYDRDWGTGRRPAVGMSRNAASRYCEWLSQRTGRSYRLPTEAEWELACGSEVPTPLDDYAWHAGNSGGMTQEVGQKRPNARGLCDMLGNLWEYCQGGYSEQQPDRAVLRGGSWAEPAAAVHPRSRLGFEDDWVLADPNVPPGVWWVPDGDHLGFRVARSVAAGR